MALTLTLQFSLSTNPPGSNENQPLLGMACAAYQNVFKTAAAAGSAWLICRTISKLGLDPRATMIFTGVASALFYSTVPLFTQLEMKENKEGEVNYMNRAVILLGLTKISANGLKLNLPFYGPFIKTTIIAWTLIALVDKGSEIIPSLVGMMNSSVHKYSYRYKKNGSSGK